MLLEEILKALAPLFIGCIVGIPIALIYLWRKFKKMENEIPTKLQLEPEVPIPSESDKEVETTWQNKNNKKKLLKKKVKSLKKNQKNLKNLKKKRNKK